jgi:hypothetical protein
MHTTELHTIENAKFTHKLRQFLFKKFESLGLSLSGIQELGLSIP